MRDVTKALINITTRNTTVRIYADNLDNLDTLRLHQIRLSMAARTVHVGCMQMRYLPLLKYCSLYTSCKHVETWDLLLNM